MFESVVLPAPFSPRSACTSPAAASNATPSFARTPGKRFVIPSIRTAGGGEAPASPAPLTFTTLTGVDSPTGLRRGDPRDAPDHAPDEPLHRVQVGKHLQTLARRHLELAALIVERPLEHVELARLDRLLLRGDQLLRLRAHARPVRRELREAVVDRAVIEAGLPRAVDRCLHALEVVEPPVVDRPGEPLLRRRALRVRVVADPGDPVLLGVDAR